MPSSRITPQTSSPCRSRRCRARACGRPARTRARARTPPVRHDLSRGSLRRHDALVGRRHGCDGEQAVRGVPRTKRRNRTLSPAGALPRPPRPTRHVSRTSPKIVRPHACMRMALVLTSPSRSSKVWARLCDLKVTRSHPHSTGMPPLTRGSRDIVSTSHTAALRNPPPGRSNRTRGTCPCAQASSPWDRRDRAGQGPPFSWAHAMAH